MMAKNTGAGYRLGSQNGVVQVYSPITGLWEKREADSGAFIKEKRDGKPFKGIRRVSS